MDSRKAREIRIRKGGTKKWLDRPRCEWSTGWARVQVNGQLSWSWPRTGDPRKDTGGSTDQDAIEYRHRKS